jgi:hypothetical protein
MRHYEAVLVWIGYGALALAAGFLGASFIEVSHVSESRPVLGALSASWKYLIPALVMGALFLLAKFYQHAMRDALEDSREAEATHASMERDLAILDKALAEAEPMDPATGSGPARYREAGSDGDGQGAAG